MIYSQKEWQLQPVVRGHFEIWITLKALWPWQGYRDDVCVVRCLFAEFTLEPNSGVAGEAVDNLVHLCSRPTSEADLAPDRYVYIGNYAHIYVPFHLYSYHVNDLVVPVLTKRLFLLYLENVTSTDLSVSLTVILGTQGARVEQVDACGCLRRPVKFHL